MCYQCFLAAERRDYLKSLPGPVRALYFLKGLVYAITFPVWFPFMLAWTLGRMFGRGILDGLISLGEKGP